MRTHQDQYGDGTVDVFGDGEGGGENLQDLAVESSPFHFGSGDGYPFFGLYALIPDDLKCLIIQMRISLNQSLGN